MSFERSGGRGPGRPGEGAASPAAEKSEALRSVRVRRVIRSSHPPAAERTAPDARDVSGARALPTSRRGPVVDGEESTETRAKKVTPAERPRRRRIVQAGRVLERSRNDTLPARPMSLQRRMQPDLGSLGVDGGAPGVCDPHGLGSNGQARAQLFARGTGSRLALGIAIALTVAGVAWALLLSR